jgi:hypothetical protein
MYFAFKWKHRDGSIIEFGPAGWYSDDPVKTDWLRIESEQANVWPIIPVRIRLWLQQQCELLEFEGMVPELG